MKLFEITSEFDDDPNSWKSPDNSWQGIKYHFRKLYSQFEQLEAVEDGSEDELEFTEKAYKEIRQKLIKYQHLWAKVPECAYGYASSIIGGRWPEGEPALAKSGKWAFLYATQILKSRFPAGEPMISRMNTGPHYKQAYESEFNCKI